MFTDALAQMVMADSLAYAASGSGHQHVQPANRRLLTTAPHQFDNSHPTAETAVHSHLVLPSLTATTEAGTTGSADTAKETDNISKAKSSNTDHMASDSAASQEDSKSTCQAEEATTVCADKMQPVMMPQAWETEEEDRPTDGLTLQQCQLLNASVCEPSVQMSKQGKGFMVVVYNALAWERSTEPIRIPLDVTADSAAHWVVTGQPLLAHLLYT